MNLVKLNQLKYKKLSLDELIINLDRLSRFKLPEESYKRVFFSIIFKNLISPKYSKKEIETLDAVYISNIVKKIWNESVESFSKDKKVNLIPNKILKLLINNSFKNYDEYTKILINTKLNIKPILKKIDYESAPLNLKFLITSTNNLKDKESITIDDLISIREKFSLRFPVKKLLIVEGITEEILLPVFAHKLGLNFDKNGIYIHSAGGKSKSPALYLGLKDKLKLPIILLFDSDAKEICSNLKNTLIKKDNYIIINNGEFEDILAINLLKRSLNNEYLPATPLKLSDLRIYPKMCENIEFFYKNRNLGEFKKAKLSKIIAQNVKYPSDITYEIKKIIYNIV